MILLQSEGGGFSAYCKVAGGDEVKNGGGSFFGNILALDLEILSL